MRINKPKCPVCDGTLQLLPSKADYFIFVLYCSHCNITTDNTTMTTSNWQIRLNDLKFGSGENRCNA